MREGATNVLRHSVASACRMTLVRRDRRLRLEVVNDGAELDGPFVGTGLVGLAERARVLAGTVDAQRAGERFRLVVEVPEEPP